MPIRLSLLILAFCHVSAGAQEPSHVDEARKLLQLMDVKATLDQTYDQIYPQLEGMADQLGITEEQRPVFEKYVEKMVEAMKEELSWQQMEPLMLDLYVEVYTEQELRDLNGFYASPTGRKFVHKMPELMQATMKMTQDMMQRLIPRLTAIQEEMMEEFRTNPDLH